MINKGGQEAAHGATTYEGNDPFTINLEGNSNSAENLTDNQRLAHEFEHGRQVLDGELSYQNYSPENGWRPFALDRTDEAKAFQAGFDMEPASPGQSNIVNGIAAALDRGGLPAAVDYLGAHTSYSRLPAGPINVEMRSPAIYEPPK